MLCDRTQTPTPLGPTLLPTTLYPAPDAHTNTNGVMGCGWDERACSVRGCVRAFLGGYVAVQTRVRSATDLCKLVRWPAGRIWTGGPLWPDPARWCCGDCGGAAGCGAPAQLARAASTAGPGAALQASTPDFSTAHSGFGGGRGSGGGGGAAGGGGGTRRGRCGCGREKIRRCRAGRAAAGGSTAAHTDAGWRRWRGRR